jgi:hypothetical protein
VAGRPASSESPSPLEALAAAVAASEAMCAETEEDLRELSRWRIRERTRLARRLDRRRERERDLVARLEHERRSASSAGRG